MSWGAFRTWVYPRIWKVARILCRFTDVKSTIRGMDARTVPAGSVGDESAREWNEPTPSLEVARWLSTRANKSVLLATAACACAPFLVIAVPISPILGVIAASGIAAGSLVMIRARCMRLDGYLVDLARCENARRESNGEPSSSRLYSTKVPGLPRNASRGRALVG